MQTGVDSATQTEVQVCDGATYTEVEACDGATQTEVEACDGTTQTEVEAHDGATRTEVEVLWTEDMEDDVVGVMTTATQTEEGLLEADNRDRGRHGMCYK